MRRAWIVLAACGLAACQPPRSEAYFEAHPQAAEQAVADCRTGAQKGPDCAAAQAADAAVKARAREALFRRGFP